MKTNNYQEEKTVSGKSRHQKLEVIGWGLFFIWIGIAVLADVGWGIGFIGVGLLILGLRAADRYLSKTDCPRT